MKTAVEFNMHVTVQLNDGETPVDIEDRLIEAVDSISEHVFMSYNALVTIDPEEE